MDTEADRAVIAVGADPRAGAVPREDGYGEYSRCQRATVVVDTDKRRHPARGEVAPERLIQLSSACLCHEPRGYRILFGNPDAVSNVAPLANSYRANKDNFARFLNLDFCSAVVDDAA